MNTLQSNINYLTNKVETNNIDKTNNDDFLKYEQDVLTNQGIFAILAVVMI